MLVCVDRGETAVHITELLKAEYPLVPVYVRAFDRGIALQLIKAGVDYQIRETVESALAFGAEVLLGLGVEPDETAELVLEVRRRDQARLEAQLTGGIQAGRGFMKGNMPVPVPAPLTPPRRPGQAMNEETAEAMDKAASAHRTEDAPAR